MKNLIGLGLAVSMSVASVACGSSPEGSSNTLHVTGSVDPQYRSLDNARAIALGSDGTAFSAYLTQSGRFTLDLPVGHVYRIVIANSTMSGELRMIGHLVNTTSDGKSASIAAKSGGSIALGALRPASAAGAGSVSTKCACPGSSDDDKGSGDSSDKGGDYGDKGGSDDSSDKGDYGDKGSGDGDKGDKGSDDGDDYKCHQKDEDKSKTCDDGDDVDLEPEHAPGDKCKADADSFEEAPAPKASSCASKDGDHDGKDDDDSADSKGGDDKGGAYGGDKGDDSSDTGSKGDDDSSKDDGTYGSSSGGDKGGASAGSCVCSKECGTGSSCVASKCTTGYTK